MGWIIVQDHGTGVLDDIRTGLNALATVLNGPNSLVEAAIPEIFDNVPDEFYRATTRILQENAEVAASRLSAVPALKPIIPQGAMYMMVMIDIDQLQDINDDVDFYQRLKWEEHVEVLPGQCFGMLNYIRIVITPPRDILCCAIGRMASFCKRHSK
ncbi:hypothetical protein EV182_007397 [Spiromyces aspiralis]|uniref:Uncharacterized protein n=1 Tax=Spiromyces aspiralis TaxID=68401 RepID=A0ACC1HN74_9FUNG|nr:hypothetical protein EV182_007397 [Spiromyces aspiralis]